MQPFFQSGVFFPRLFAKKMALNIQRIFRAGMVMSEWRSLMVVRFYIHSRSFDPLKKQITAIKRIKYIEHNISMADK